MKDTQRYGKTLKKCYYAGDEMNCDIKVTTCGFQKIVKSTFGIPIIDTIKEQQLIVVKWSKTEGTS